MRIDGKWEGKLLDASGPSALVVLHLKSVGDKIKGDFSVSFVSPSDGCGCDGPVSRVAQTGPVSGKYDSKANRVQLSYDLTIGLEPTSVAFECSVVNADPHARRAMVGCYAISNGGKTLTLEGGGCVLWLYGNAATMRTKGGD